MGYQLDLFKDALESVGHGATGDGGTESGALEVRQTSTAADKARALTHYKALNNERNRRGTEQVCPVV